LANTTTVRPASLNHAPKEELDKGSKTGTSECVCFQVRLVPVSVYSGVFCYYNPLTDTHTYQCSLSLSDRHNPKSKLTEKILASPNTGKCKRCHDKIEWRKQYRKYKPLSQPGKCNLCQKRNVVAAYHTICTGCAITERAFHKMNALKETESGSDAVIKSDPENLLDRQEDEVSQRELPQQEHMEGFKVCAMCCKEKALPDQNDCSEMEQEIEDKKLAMEEKLGRPLRLRESKGIERKVERAVEIEKQLAKEERRRLRDEAAKATKQKTGNDIDTKTKKINSGGRNDIESDDEEDPFLKAIGGQAKMLTGEAYQKYLLAMEEEKKGVE